MKRRSLIMLCAVLVLGCTTERAAAPAADSVGYALYRHGEAVPQRRQRPQIGYDAYGRPAPAALNEVVVTAAAGELAPVRPADIASNMVMRTATASVQVDSLEPAVAALRQLAGRLGGYVANSGIETGRNQLKQAEIELKIPATRFDEVLSGLTPIGKLESVNVSAEDVGEQYVDVNTRIANAKRLEQRLIDLLAKRTGKLKDVLDVEQALARVREEIERYEGRIRYLKAHTAMSTLTVTVHEPMPVVGAAGHSVMGEAVAQAWRNFVALVSLGVQSLGVVLPLGLVAVVAWTATRRWRLARQRTA